MKSFINAFNGIIHALKTERNMRIHLAALFYVILAGIFFHLHPRDWALIALACGLVFGAELINTALERLCDGLEPGHSSVVKSVKDLAAGAVLICAVVAVGVAVFVVWGGVYYYDGAEWSHFAGSPQFRVGVAALPLWVLYIILGGGRANKNS
jgi:diacylglycerol kinase